MSSPLLKARRRTLAVLEMLTTAGPAERTTVTTGVTRPMGWAWACAQTTTRANQSSHGVNLMIFCS